MKPVEYAELRAFAAVLRHGTFTLGAAHLGVTPSALSQTVRALEERLGVRLLNRTTRSVAPTQAGERLAARLLPVLDDLDGVVDAAAEEAGEVSGLLRLNVTRIALPLLGRILPDFLTRFPRVRLAVAADDVLVDIVRDGFDAGIRLAERLEADMIAVRFGDDLRMAAVAAAGYLERHGTPAHPRDLAGHRCLVTLSPSSGTPYRWEFEQGDQALRIAVDGPLISGDPDLRRAAAVAGLGIGYFFETEVQAELDSGALVRVLDDWTPPFPGCFLYYPSRRHPPPALRAFVDHLRAWKGQGPSGPAP